MNEKIKKLLINLAVSVIVWLIFVIAFSAAREDVSFIQAVTNPIGIIIGVASFICGLVNIKKLKHHRDDDFS